MKRENRPSAPKHIHVVIKKKKDNIANQLQNMLLQKRKKKKDNQA